MLYLTWPDWGKIIRKLKIIIVWFVEEAGVGGLVRGKEPGEVGLINGNSWYAFSKHIPCLVSEFLVISLKTTQPYLLVYY